MHQHTSSHQTKLGHNSKQNLVDQFELCVHTWKSSVILDVGLDSCLLEGLLCYVHDLLGSTCQCSMNNEQWTMFIEIVFSLLQKRYIFCQVEHISNLLVIICCIMICVNSLTSTFDWAVWKCEKRVPSLEVLDCFCCLFHILHTGKYWVDLLPWMGITCSWSRPLVCQKLLVVPWSSHT